MVTISGGGELLLIFNFSTRSNVRCDLNTGKSLECLDNKIVPLSARVSIGGNEKAVDWEYNFSLWLQATLHTCRLT